MFGTRILLAPLVALLVATANLQACEDRGPTLSSDANQAKLIVLGTLSNAKADPNEPGKGTTEMSIEIVVKDHEYLHGKKSIILPRYVPAAADNKLKCVVFCQIDKGQPDPYRGVPVPPESKIVEYLKGSLDVCDKDVAARLQHFFNYLDSPDNVVAADAFREFGKADYRDAQKVYHTFAAGTVVKWLKDPNTPASRCGLFGSILGHCGNATEHAPLLREMLDDPKRRSSAAGIMDGMLAGYAILDPKAGWKYVRDLLADEKHDYLMRYAALRTARFFWDYRRDVIPEREIVDAMKLLIAQGDLADLPIEDLRRWRRWELTDTILSFYGTESHRAPITKRAIIRFALCAAPYKKEAAVFVKLRREEDPERIVEIVQLLLEIDGSPVVVPRLLP